MQTLSQHLLPMLDLNKKRFFFFLLSFPFPFLFSSIVLTRHGRPQHRADDGCAEPRRGCRTLQKGACASLA